jgi:plastocyanin
MSRMRLTVIVAALLVFPSVVGAAAEHRVGQKNKTFSVATLLIKSGDRVTFYNDDQLTHNVYSAQKGNAFNLKAQSPGTSSSVTFDREGTYEVRCAFHPRMKLLVVVKD